MSGAFGLERAGASVAGDGRGGQGGGGDPDGPAARASSGDEVAVAPGRGAGGGFALPPQIHGFFQGPELGGIGGSGAVGDGGEAPPPPGGFGDLEAEFAGELGVPGVVVAALAAGVLDA